jgi:3-deoxy-D-manno-octulosonic-acid transferase
VAALRDALPGAAILVSTTTPTGQAQARRELPQASLHFYFPFDLPWVTRRVLARLQPSAIVLMEAELWPNLLAAARRRGIPVIVANAHLSDRTLRRARRLRPLLAPLFAGITRYLAQSAAIRDRAIALGMPPERAVVTGHTKFDQQVPVLSPSEAAAVRGGLGLAPDQPLFLAGSTHEGEEELVLDAWEAARRRIPQLALMLAPRHLARAAAIRARVEQRGYAVRTRSEMTARSAHHRDTETQRTSAVTHGDGRNERDDRKGSVFPGEPVHHARSCESSGEVLLLDTMGELAKFYGLAAVAFVGGSLVPKGGHDILQPLFQGVPTLFGPHMHNQRALASLCLGAGAARQVGDSTALAEAVAGLVDDPEERKGMLSAAARLLAENRGAAARCASVVAELVHARSGSPFRVSDHDREPGTGHRVPDPAAPVRP